MDKPNFPRGIYVIAAALLLLAAPGFAGSNEASPAANKAGAADSSFVYLGNAENPLGATTVLSTPIKTGSSDLLIQVALECSLVTEVVSTTIDDHPNGYTALGRAEAYVVGWLEIDGEVVTVGASDGRITFCDRVHEQEISDIDEDTGNFTIRQLQETMTANAFNWVALDLAPGWHTVELVMTVDAANTEGSFAEGGIGDRTLIVDPIKFANGAEVLTQNEPAEETSGEAAAASASSAGTFVEETPEPAQQSFLDWLSGLL